MGTALAGESRTEREGMLACLVNDARALSPRAAVAAIVDGFKENDLLTYASAISFQVFFALVPLALMALALLGTFGFSEVWSRDVAPALRDNLSPAAFQVVSDTVAKVLRQRQLFWATLGAVIAVWEVSGAMRATMQVLNRVYDVPERRSLRRKLAESIALSTVVTILLLLAAGATKLGPVVARAVFGTEPVVAALAAIASWAAAVALLFLVVTLVVRFAPDTRRPVRWVSFGAVLVIAGWIVVSLVYGWYISSVADYASVLGNLAVVMVTMSYIYLSAIVFLTGVQLDSLIRGQVDRSDPPATAP
jgi:membrane protein